jgi:hypothetical protein
MDPETDLFLLPLQPTLLYFALFRWFVFLLVRCGSRSEESEQQSIFLKLMKLMGLSTKHVVSESEALVREFKREISPFSQTCNVF